MGRYTLEFWRAIRGRDDLEVRAFAAGRGARLQSPVRQLRIPLRVMHLAWSSVGWPRAETLVGDVRVVHSLDMLPAPTRKPLVMTVQDLFAVTHPEFCSPRTRQLQLRQLAAARRAQLVVTLSDATADLIAAHLGMGRDRVIATSAGVGALAEAPGAPADDAPILAVGAVTPRKGFEVLAAAASRLARPRRLIIAGPDGYRAAEVRAAIGGTATFAGFVDDTELARLYRSAAIVCVPSRAEGFGLPCLEAMAQGAAVVATDLPSLREIAAGAAVLVPPGEPDAWVAALDKVLGDPGLRNDLAARALKRAAEFTWSAAADRLVGAYRLAAAA